MFDFFFLATIFWKSILKTRKVISQGAKWRVGDRCDIQIFEDKWLLGIGEGSGRVLSPNQFKLGLCFPSYRSVLKLVGFALN